MLCWAGLGWAVLGCQGLGPPLIGPVTLRTQPLARTSLSWHLGDRFKKIHHALSTNSNCRYRVVVNNVAILIHLCVQCGHWAAGGGSYRLHHTNHPQSSLGLSSTASSRQPPEDWRQLVSWPGSLALVAILNEEQSEQRSQEPDHRPATVMRRPS